ncbi:unnamed protein product [Rangifer tarandus platyrhynchus]|uniref:Secreted protein n=1 Tax=Rangifer tarandus platyrhynchus TaxID=3082113 RepID=A0ABN8ZBU2_RANTA|nr:unnamed protein product [Rangifer tarandus platyrhynchus]
MFIYFFTFPTFTAVLAIVWATLIRSLRQCSGSARRFLCSIWCCLGPCLWLHLAGSLAELECSRWLPGMTVGVGRQLGFSLQQGICASYLQGTRLQTVLGLSCCEGFSLVAASGDYSSRGAWISQCGVFSYGGAQALERRLSSCGAWD